MNLALPKQREIVCGICNLGRFKRPNNPIGCAAADCRKTFHRQCLEKFDQCPQCKQEWPGLQDPQKFLEDLYQEENEDDCCYYVFSKADDFFYMGQFEEWEEIMSKLDFERAGSSAVYAMLAVTNWPPQGLLQGIEQFKLKVIKFFEDIGKQELADFIKKE